MTGALLIAFDWYSRCSACGGNAWPDEATHDRGGDFLRSGTGCGAEFTALALHVTARGLDDTRPSMRSDLPYVGRWPIPTPEPERT